MVAIDASLTASYFGRDEGRALGRKGTIFVGLLLLHAAVIATLIAEHGGTPSPTRPPTLTVVRLLPARSSIPVIPFVPPTDADRERWQPPPLSMPRIELPADRPDRAAPSDPCAPGTERDPLAPKPDCGPPAHLNMPKGFEMDESGRPIENGAFARPETPEDAAAVARSMERRDRELKATFGLKNAAPTSAEKRPFQSWERDVVPLAPTNTLQKGLRWNDEFLQPGAITPSIPPLPE
ncbi:MAG TPA: hypothetical protein VM689_15690 [Aliidongia sp.]|nr:hypothetical protein [Aliidongia sp.]